MAVTLPSGDCSSVPAAVWLGDGVADDLATLTPDRGPDASRSGLAAAEGLGRSVLAAADGLGRSVAEGLGRSAASSGLTLSAAPDSC